MMIRINTSAIASVKKSGQCFGAVATLKWPTSFVPTTTLVCWILSWGISGLANVALGDTKLELQAPENPEQTQGFQIVTQSAWNRAQNHSGEQSTQQKIACQSEKVASEPSPLGHPRDVQARALFNRWQTLARRQGALPGGVVALLKSKVREFIQNNSNDRSGAPYAMKMQPLIERLETSRDWTPLDAGRLLDDVASITTIPLETTLDALEDLKLLPGATLPKELSNAPWGDPLPNGLRLAWYLEPQSKLYRIGTPLKSRILIHNSGSETVVFRTQSWHQSAGHQAHDAQNDSVEITSVEWTTLGHLNAYQLAPNQFIEVLGAGIGVGEDHDQEDWQGTRVGAWIHAKAGATITFTPDHVRLRGGNEVISDHPAWWEQFLTERLRLELPLPDSAEERSWTLRRIMLEIFKQEPTPTEIDVFQADRSPDALDQLAARLISRPEMIAYAGDLKSSTRKFRVLPPDPEEHKRPRVASNPGRYTINPTTRLAVSRRPMGERIVNQASLQFYATEAGKPNPAPPFELQLPEGYESWQAIWMRDSTIVWLKTAQTIKKLDLSDPKQIKQWELKLPDDLRQVPLEIQRVWDPMMSSVDNQ